MAAAQARRTDYVIREASDNSPPNAARPPKRNTPHPNLLNRASLEPIAVISLVHLDLIASKFGATREAASSDVFEYIEMLCNPKRKHTEIDMLSPVDFENRLLKLNEAVVSETRGTSMFIP